MIRVLRVTACLFMGLVLMRSAPASADHTEPVLYRLGEGSAFEFGCYDPCACPLSHIEDLHGDFVLRHVGFDGLFDTYALSMVRWKAAAFGLDVRVTGSGTYRIGGEFALQHRLTLDLEVDDQPAQRYDSGLQVGGSEFPAIHVGVSRHGFFCVDSAFVVDASPAPAGTDDAPAARPGITRVTPNPFGAAAAVEFSLAREARTEVVVFDPGGRRVRVLATPAWRPAGVHRLDWDGRRDDGTAARPGLYFVRLSADGLRDVRAIVRL